MRNKEKQERKTLNFFKKLRNRMTEDIYTAILLVEDRSTIALTTRYFKIEISRETCVISKYEMDIYAISKYGVEKVASDLKDSYNNLSESEVIALTSRAINFEPVLE